MLAMTRSGFAARISAVFAVQLSWRMGRLRVANSGRASRQYFVQAQSASRRLRSARVIVIEGWREAIRMEFQYCRLGCGGTPLPPSKSVQSLRTRDFRFGLRVVPKVWSFRKWGA